MYSVDVYDKYRVVRKIANKYNPRQSMDDALEEPYL